MKCVFMSVSTSCKMHSLCLSAVHLHPLTGDSGRKFIEQVFPDGNALKEWDGCYLQQSSPVTSEFLMIVVAVVSFFIHTTGGPGRWTLAAIWWTRTAEIRGDG